MGREGGGGRWDLEVADDVGRRSGPHENEQQLLQRGDHQLDLSVDNGGRMREKRESSDFICTDTV